MMKHGPGLIERSQERLVLLVENECEQVSGLTYRNSQRGEPWGFCFATCKLRSKEEDKLRGEGEQVFLRDQESLGTRRTYGTHPGEDEED